MKNTPRWLCGHERTEANTKLVRNRTGKACLICFRALNRDYMRRRRAARDSDAMLGTKPEGLSPEGAAARAACGIAQIPDNPKDSA